MPETISNTDQHSQHVSFCFGRLNPPHFGHQGLMQTVQTSAKGGAWFIFVSKSHDNNKNPLSYPDKLKWISTLYPQVKGHLVPDPEIRTVLQAAAYLYGKGYRTATFVAGEDDMPQMRKLLEDYNGIEGKSHGMYAFDQLTFVESPRLTSATNAREAARNNDAEAFERATQVSPNIIVDGKTLMQAVRAGMGLGETMEENFKDGRHPEDKGDAKRHGVPTKASVSTLRKVAKQGGRKGQLAHWMANMKAGKKKASESKLLDNPTPTVKELAAKYNVPTKQVNLELAKGIKIEMEHSSDVDVAREIALDHLNEKLNYYTLLKKVETEDKGVSSPTSQLGDRAVAVNPFDYYTPFMSEDIQLDEVNLKKVRSFANDPFLDQVNLAWELELIWPNHDDDRDRDDDYSDFESEPDYDTDETINTNTFAAFERDVMNFFRGDHNSRSDVRDAIATIKSEYDDYLSDLWSELDDEEKEEEYGGDEDKFFAARSDEDFETWCGDNDLHSMSDLTNFNGVYLTWPNWTEPDEDYGRSDKGELTRDDLRDMFLREFGTMLTQDGFNVIAWDSPSKNKEPGTWYIEPDGSLTTDDDNDGGVEITSPIIPYKRSLEYLDKMFAWAKRNGAYTSASNSTGMHLNLSLPEPEMDKVDWVKLILMGGDDRVLRDFDRWASGEFTWAKSALKYLKQNASKGVELDTDMVIKAVRAGLTPEARKEAEKIVQGGKYMSVHPKGETDAGNFKWVEFRSAGGDTLSELPKLKTAALQYARSLYIASNPEVEKKEYASKLFSLLGNLKSTEPGLRALQQFASGKIDKDMLKYYLGKAAVARGQTPKYTPSGNMYVFKPSTSRNNAKEIQVLASSLMAAVPRAMHIAVNEYEVSPFYYKFEAQTGEKVFSVETPDRLEGTDRRAGMLVIATNGAEAAELVSGMLGLPVNSLQAVNRSNAYDLEDMSRWIKAKWTTKEQIDTVNQQLQQAAAERAAADQRARDAGGVPFKITNRTGTSTGYDHDTQIAISAEDAITKFLAANQLYSGIKEYFKAVPVAPATTDEPAAASGEPRSVFQREPQPQAASQPNPAAAETGTFIITYLDTSGAQHQTAYDANSVNDASQSFIAQHPRTYTIVSVVPHQVGQQTESLAESLLAEVNMGAGALADFAKSEMGKSIRVGFEAEMLVPDMSDTEPQWDDDLEPNWDENRTIRFDRNWRTQIQDFWGDGDYNYESRREIERAIEEMDEEYQEHVSDQFADYLDSEEGIAALMASIRENEAGTADLSDDEISELDDYANFMESARDDLSDRWTSDYMSDDSNFIDWAKDNSLDDMIGFANRFGLSWPYQTPVSRGGSMSMSDLAKEFTRYSGYDSDAGSYSTSPDDTTSIFKPDSSIKRLDLPDNYSGVEFASAFRPLPETMDMLQKFYKWAGQMGAEANQSTGFHMGVSIPQHTRDTVDVMKFILFLGDEKVLADFGRQASTWCKSSLAKIRSNTNEARAKEALAEFRKGLDTEAAKMMRRRLLPTGDRYVSVNYKDDYIEIRSGGGNFFDQKDVIVNTMLRYVRVLGLAANPEEARQEYAKKLYKVLSKNLRDETSDTIQYFAQYAAGTMPSTALKSFVRQTQNQRKRDREIKAATAPATGLHGAGKWELYKVLRRADDFEVHEFMAPNAYQAQYKLEQWARAGRMDSQDYTIVKANQQPNQQSQDDDIDFGHWEPEPEPQRPTGPNAWSPNARIAYQLVDRTGSPIAYFTDGTRMPTNSLFYAANSDDAGRRAADLDRVHGLPMGYIVRPFNSPGGGGGTRESTEPRSLYQSIVEQEQLSELTQNPSAFRKFLNSEVANQITMGFEAEMCVKGLDLNSRSRPGIPADVDAEAVFPFDEEGQTRYYEFWLANGANTRSEVSVGLDKLRRRMETWMRAHAEDEEVTPAHWKRFLRGGGHRNWTNMLELNRELELEWPYGESSDTLTRDKLKRDFQNSTGYQAELHGGYHSQRKPDDKFVFEFDGSIRAGSGDGGQELVSHAMPLPEAVAALDKMFAWANDKGYVYTNSSTGFHVNVGMAGLNTGKLDKMKLLLLLGDKKILTDFEREANSYCRSMLGKVQNTLERRITDQQRSELLASLRTDTWKGLRSLANRYVESAHGGEKYVSVNFKGNYIEFRSPGGDWMNHQADIRNTVLRISQAYAVSASPTEGQQDYLKKAYTMLSGMSKGPDDSMKLFVDYSMGKINQSQLKAQLQVMRSQGRTASQYQQQAASSPSSSNAGQAAASTNTGEYSDSVLAALPGEMADSQSWSLIDQDDDEVNRFTGTAQEAVSYAQDISESNPEYTFSLEDNEGLTFATFSSGGRVYYADRILRAARENGWSAEQTAQQPAAQAGTDTINGVDYGYLNPRRESRSGWTFYHVDRNRPGDTMDFNPVTRINGYDALREFLASYPNRMPILMVPGIPSDFDLNTDQLRIAMDVAARANGVSVPASAVPTVQATTDSDQGVDRRFRIQYRGRNGQLYAQVIDADDESDARQQFTANRPTARIVRVTVLPQQQNESVELDEVTQNPAVWDRFLSSEAAAQITMGFEAEMLVKGLVQTSSRGIIRSDDRILPNIRLPRGQKNFIQFWTQNDANSKEKIIAVMNDLTEKYGNDYRELNTMSDLLQMRVLGLKWPFATRDVLTRNKLADMFTQATGYKIKVGQSAGKDAFGLVNDGSLDPKEGDGGVELVSYAMPLPEAMEALNKTFQWARDSKLIYTNSSSGFHVNVGIKGTKPKDIDKLKLLLLVGDQAILKEFGRMKNEYCESMLLRLKKALKWKRTGKDPNTDSGGWWGSDDSDVNRADDEINATMAALRKETWAGLRNIANTLVDNIHDDNKYVSINAHSNYIEFRSPGGNWMPKWDQIYYTVLRVTHAYALAADPVEGKQDYLKKAYKILSTGTEQNDELKTFLDYSMGKVDAAKLKAVLIKKHTQGPANQPAYGIAVPKVRGQGGEVHRFHAENDKAARQYANQWAKQNLPYAQQYSYSIFRISAKDLAKTSSAAPRPRRPAREPASSAARATQQSAGTNTWMVSHSDGQGDFMITPVTATTAAQARTIFQHNRGNQLAIYDVEPHDPDMHGDIDDEGHLQQNDQEPAAANMWDVWFMHQDPDDDAPSEISNRVRADSAEAAMADWNRRHPRSPARRVTPANESISESKTKPKKPKTIVDGAIKTLVGKGRSEDEAIADLKKEVDKKFYNENKVIFDRMQPGETIAEALARARSRLTKA